MRGVFGDFGDGRTSLGGFFGFGESTVLTSGSGLAGSDLAGSGLAGSGLAGSGLAGSGSGWAGSGLAGSGWAGSGWAGSAGSGWTALASAGSGWTALASAGSGFASEGDFGSATVRSGCAATSFLAPLNTMTAAIAAASVPVTATMIIGARERRIWTSAVSPRSSEARARMRSVTSTPLMVG